MNYPEVLSAIRTETLQKKQEGISNEELKIAVLGRKGSLTGILRSLSDLPIEQRKEVGSAAHALKLELEELLSESSDLPAKRSFDPTVPPFPTHGGTIHPLSSMIYEIVSIFQDLSFEVVEGDELVDDIANFESLNITKDHPARDSHDTFFVEDDLLLRTHTSAVQVLELRKRMKMNDMPVRIVVPGKTYRRDSDATHSPMFHQIEGVMVDTQTTFADLKGVLAHVATRLFGDQIETRFRTHFFPFTEPSAEIDIRWKNAKGEGKHTEWIEWLGCGMIHPKVLENAGINPRIYQGWAFGGGVERPVMIRQQVPDLRKFFTNSAHFLDQFGDTL
jgi:phenylalanyl-tRNA synthetase alpha chain